MERLAVRTSTIGGNINGLQQYVLAAYPDFVINERIALEKQRLHEQYGLKNSTANEYITIAGFAGRLPIEETIIRWIERVCSKINAFDVTLNNFSGFPPGKVYLRILNQQPFRQLAGELKSVDEFIQSNACPPIEIASSINIPIAVNLPSGIYEEALMQYSQKSFHETFTVKQLVLLRRANNYEERKVLCVFPLKAPGIQLYN